MSPARDFSTHPEPARRPVLLLAMGGLCLVLAAQQAWAARSARESAQERLDRARGDVASLRDEVRRREAASRTNDVGRRAALALKAPPPRVLAEITALLPEGVRLDGLDLTYGPHIELDLRVVARRAADYDVFLERLTGSPRFTAVIPGAEARGGEVRAGVRARYVTRGEEP